VRTPSDRAARCFAEIVAAIDLMRAWVDQARGVEQATLRDPLIRSATERQLLIISEAAIRLDKLDPEAPSDLASGIDWPGIRGIGNFIRHRYDDLDTAILIDVVANRLEPLRAAAEHALARIEAGKSRDG
jgi:uncharacterized protein with HEPN domain